MNDSKKNFTKLLDEFGQKTFIYEERIWINNTENPEFLPEGDIAFFLKNFMNQVMKLSQLQDPMTESLSESELKDVKSKFETIVSLSED